MLDVGMSLAIVVASHELDGIPMNVRPVVSLSKEFVCQGPASKMTLVYAFIDLVQGIISL